MVAALGYFVDAYDLILFVVIRKSSLLSLGVPENLLAGTGLNLFNIQMIGTFLGGIFFGVMGDKKGRLSVLFGSIMVYSLANLLNAGVDQLWQYFVLRFVAGFGLAGELGAGITLVSEVMPKEKRGYGTAIVAASGALGAVFAGLLGDLTAWRISFCSSWASSNRCSSLANFLSCSFMAAFITASISCLISSRSSRVKLIYVF